MILYLISLRQAIRTCVLSSRWRSIWKSMPYLNFSNDRFFPNNFVSNVLSHRNTKMQLSSVHLGHCKAVTSESVERILDYTFSHNIQQLTIITRSFERSFRIGDALSSFKATPTSYLPALTTLHLHYRTLSDDNITCLLSKCPNLKNLSLGGDIVTGTNVLNICHPRLSNLTLEHICGWLPTFNVVAPQLKNLTTRNCEGKHLMKFSAPELTSLVMKGLRPMQLSTKGFPSLEKADLCFSHPRLEHAHKLVCLIQYLHNVKFLTLNLKILELLSSSMEPISHQPSPFANLKILKFLTSYPITVYMEVQPYEDVTTSTEIKNNLQESFPSAIITMISCEEIRAMRNIVTAQQLIPELRMLLEKCKALGYTTKAQMGHTNVPMESCKAQVNKQWTQLPLEMPWHFGKKMAQVYDQWNIKGSLVAKLQRIEGLLTGLPVSKSPAMQAISSSVCEQADDVRKNMLVCMKIRNSKKPRHFNI